MEKEENYKVPEYPNKEKGYFMDEQKFAKFSKNIFRNSIFGYLIGIYLNLVFLYCWRYQTGIIATLITLFINYLIIQIILVKFFGIKEEM